MVSELIPAIILGGAITGSALNSVRAYLQDPNPTATFSFKKLAGALVGAVLAGFAASQQITTTADGSLIVLFGVAALAGAGISTLLAKAHA